MLKADGFGGVAYEGGGAGDADIEEFPNSPMMSFTLDFCA
jgi:hypothetical protein